MWVATCKKMYELAFADKPALKDMIKALHRQERKKTDVYSSKSKIVMFSKVQFSGVVWEVYHRKNEEVDEFNYLGVTLQRNEGYTRQHKAVVLKGHIRATEVWS